MTCNPSKNVAFGAKFLPKGNQRILVAGASSLSSVFHSVSSLSSRSPRSVLYELMLVLTTWLLSLRLTYRDPHSLWDVCKLMIL